MRGENAVPRVETKKADKQCRCLVNLNPRTRPKLIVGASIRWIVGVLVAHVVLVHLVGFEFRLPYR